MNATANRFREQLNQWKAFEREALQAESELRALADRDATLANSALSRAARLRKRADDYLDAILDPDATIPGRPQPPGPMRAGSALQ